MQIMAALEMLSVTVLDDVGMPQGLEDAKFGVELVLLFVGHATVGYLFAAEDLSCGLLADFADYAEGALAWEGGRGQYATLDVS